MGRRPNIRPIRSPPLAIWTPDRNPAASQFRASTGYNMNCLVYGLTLIQLYSLINSVISVLSLPYLYSAVLTAGTSGVYYLLAKPMLIDKQKNWIGWAEIGPKYKLRRTLNNMRQQRAKGRKPANNMDTDKQTQFITRLNIILDPNTPDRCREILVSDICSFSPIFRTMQKSAILSVWFSLWMHIGKRASLKYRQNLVRLAHNLFNISQGSSSELITRMIEDQSIKVHHSWYRRAPNGTFIRMESLSRELNLESCLFAIKHHYEKGEEILLSYEHKVIIAESLNDTFPLNCEFDTCLMPFLLTEISTADGKLHRYICNTIENILTVVSPSDAITVLTRYYPLMEKAINCMTGIWDGFLSRDEFAEIVTRSPKLLRHIAQRVIDCEDLTDSVSMGFTVIVQGLKQVNNLSILEELFALGYLHAVKNFCYDGNDNGGQHYASVLSRVIALCPAWKSKIKEMTEDGDEDNSVANLGRNIVISPSRPHLYNLDDEYYAVL